MERVCLGSPMTGAENGFVFFILCSRAPLAQPPKARSQGIPIPGCPFVVNSIRGIGFDLFGATTPWLELEHPGPDLWRRVFRTAVV